MAIPRSTSPAPSACPAARELGGGEPGVRGAGLHAATRLGAAVAGWLHHGQAGYGRAPDAEWVLMYRLGLSRQRIADLVRAEPATVGYRRTRMWDRHACGRAGCENPQMRMSCYGRRAAPYLR